MNVRTLADINMDVMDNEFKFWYSTWMYSLLHQKEPDWKRQVVNLHELWEDTGKLIVKDEFFMNFTKSCTELNLEAELYDMESGFEKANTVWKEELMLEMADHIIKTYDDSVSLDTTDVVYIENGRIRVDPTKCDLMYPSFYI